MALQLLPHYTGTGAGTRDATSTDARACSWTLDGQQVEKLERSFTTGGRGGQESPERSSTSNCGGAPTRTLYDQQVDRVEKLERRVEAGGQGGQVEGWPESGSTSKCSVGVLSMRDSSKSVVEFSLTVPGAFGSVWAMWSAADVAISLATSGVVTPMSDPLVQLAALGTASGMGMLSLYINYSRSSRGAPTGHDVDPELGTITMAQPADASQQEQRLSKDQPEIKQEMLSPVANAGRSPSMLFTPPDEPSETLKL